LTIGLPPPGADGILLSRRKLAAAKLEAHQAAYSAAYKCCPSSVGEHLIGSEEVVGSTPTGSTNYSPTERGSLSEVMVMTKLMWLGASVWTPAFGHDHSFDLIAHFDGCLSRIQVKTANDGNADYLKFNGNHFIGNRSAALTSADCDVIVAYQRATDLAYVVRPVGKYGYQLRRTPPKNGQVIGIMYEQDFRLTSLDQIRPIK
jgi:hypothetical protein